MARYSGTPTYQSFNGQQVQFSAPSIGSSFYNAFQSVLYQVQRFDRLDKIASDFYNGRGDLWWIISQANNCELPTDISAGQIIRIPSDYKSVIQAITNLNKGVVKP